MRKIEFRGTCVDTLHKGEIKKGYFLKSDNNYLIYEKDRWFKISKESLSQNTGLKDKNGTYIFEGDILNIKEYENIAMDLTEEERDLFELSDLRGKMLECYSSEVSFEDGEFLASSKNGSFSFCGLCQDPKHTYPIFDIEIIGNIHEGELK